MFFYVFLVFIIALLAQIFSSLNIHNKEKKFLIISWALLFFVSAFRAPSVGVDTSTNLMFYEDFVFTRSSIYEEGEIGLHLIYIILDFFNASPQWLLISTSFITITLIFMSIYKMSSNVYASVLLFVILYYFAQSLNTARQFISIALGLYSMHFIFDKKPIKFLLTCILAYIFHNASAILFPLVIFSIIKINTRVVFLITIASVLFLYSAFFITEAFLLILYRYMNWLEDLGSEYRALLPIIKHSCFIALGTYILFFKKNYNEIFLIKYTLIIIGILPLLLIYMGYSPIFQRVSIYFTVILIIFIPDCLKYITNKFARTNLYLIIFIFALTIYIYYIYTDFIRITPYSLVF